MFQFSVSGGMANLEPTTRHFFQFKIFRGGLGQGCHNMGNVCKLKNYARGNLRSCFYHQDLKCSLNKRETKVIGEI